MAKKLAYQPSVVPSTIYTSELLVIGHDDMLQTCLTPLLAKYPYRLVIVHSIRMALSVLAERSIMATLININQVEPEAHRICAILRDKSAVPIVMVSANKRTQEIVASFEAGADHHLVMPFAAQELDARIQATQRRLKLDKPEKYCITQGEFALDPVKQELRIKDVVIDLTTNESKLLKYLVRNANQVIRTEELLQFVWGCNAKDDLSLVRTTIHRLRSKIEIDPTTPKYLKTIFGLGYRFSSTV